MELTVKVDETYDALRKLAPPILELASQVGCRCRCGDDPEADGRLNVCFDGVKLTELHLISL